jgi:hypothetical protein
MARWHAKRHAEPAAAHTHNDRCAAAWAAPQRDPWCPNVSQAGEQNWRRLISMRLRSGAVHSGGTRTARRRRSTRALGQLVKLLYVPVACVAFRQVAPHSRALQECRYCRAEARPCRSDNRCQGGAMKPATGGPLAKPGIGHPANINKVASLRMGVKPSPTTSATTRLKRAFPAAKANTSAIDLRLCC